MEKKITAIPRNRMLTRRLQSTRSEKRIRTAAYCRVSTELEEQQNSFENQVRYYTEKINNDPRYEMVDIYADEGISGTGTKKRTDFNRMIRDCEQGKIDMIITKSISRFARNTQDCLFYTRKLKALGINVVFEKENIDLADATGELLITILGSLAQEESRNISENSKWGIRSKFKQGIAHINTNGFMGYDKDADGKLIINNEQAKLVRRIFRDFEEGMTVSAIAAELNRENVKGVKGKASWSRGTIIQMLQNEKYKGDLLLQKVYTSDYLTKKLVKNHGEVDQYYVEKDHEPIIPVDEWEAVQEEMHRRANFLEEHGLKNLGHTSCGSPFVSRVFCKKCGCRVGRKSWSNRGIHLWVCENKQKKNGSTCDLENVPEEKLRKAMVIIWNGIVAERQKEMGRWNDMIQAGSSLERMRAKQMIDLTAEGKITEEIPELTRMVLEHIDVSSATELEVFLLDGSRKKVIIP